MAIIALFLDSCHKALYMYCSIGVVARKMTNLLSKYAAIVAGYPFRGAITESRGGGYPTIQMKDVDVLQGIKWDQVVKTKLTGKREPDWLKAGDTVFVTKGRRNTAVCLSEQPEHAVCSPHLFVIRATPDGPLLPEFLAWQINQPEAQRYFRQSSEGSGVQNVRREILEKLPVAVPPIEKQQQIVAFAKAAAKEQIILNNLIENRKQQMHALASGILNQTQG